MEIKLIEIRDRATFIPAMAVRLGARNEHERYLLRRAGYAVPDGHVALPEPGDDTGQFYVLLTNLNGGGTCEYDIYAWNNRTMVVAHQWLLRSWHTIKSGDVLDVQFILGETAAPKISERAECPL